MATSSDRPDHTTDLTEVAVLAHRAGLRLSSQELASMVDGYQKTRAALRTLRESLDPTEEPGITFWAGEHASESHAR